MVNKVTTIDDTYKEPNGNQGALVTYGNYWSKIQHGTDSPSDHSVENAYGMTLLSTGEGVYRTADWRYLGRVDGKPIYGWNYFDLNSGHGTMSQNWTTNDDIALVNKLAEKFNGHQFNSGVAAAELGEAADMIFNRGRQLLAAARAAKKGRFDIAANILTASSSSGGSYSARVERGRNKARERKNRGKIPHYKRGDRSLDRQSFSEGWLELQWGWVPLLSDVWELTKLLDQLGKPRVERLVVRRRVNGTLVIPVEQPWMGHTGTIYTKKQIIAEIKEVDFPILNMLGLDDPASLIWELTPFSCIADYFYPAGNYLAARNFTRAVTGTFITTKMQYVDALYFVKSPRVPPAVPLSTKVANRHKQITLDRVVSSTIGVELPTPRFMDMITNPKKVANVAALIGAILF